MIHNLSVVPVAVQTIIPCNSDTEVPKMCNESVFDKKIAEWRAMGGDANWTTFMDGSFSALANAGVGRELIRAALESIRIHPALKGALIRLKAAAGKLSSDKHDETAAKFPRNIRLAIVSDANDWFIGEILRSNGLEGLFDQVITNRASFEEVHRNSDSGISAEESGGACGAGDKEWIGSKASPASERLRLEGYTNSYGSPHHCQRGCPANICKVGRTKCSAALGCDAAFKR